jgi:alcohol dehydrogenase
LVESPALNTTVLPFILRGVNLLGVDSVEIPLAKKQAMWDLLASDWQLPEIESLTSEIGFDELGDALDKVLAGGAIGRYVVKLD